MSDLSRLINYKYRDYYADLIDGVPTGPVEGYHLNNHSNTQSWEIAVVGGNQLTIRNAATNTYASVSSETQGSQVVGSATPYTWRQIQVTGGWYQIATTDGRYIWYLTGEKDYAPIVLERSIYQGKDAQWGHERAVRVVPQ